MKRFVLAALAALVFVSCSKEELCEDVVIYTYTVQDPSDDTKSHTFASEENFGSIGYLVPFDVVIGDKLITKYGYLTNKTERIENNCE